MIKKDDRAFLGESLRGHIAKAKEDLERVVEGICLRGDLEDLEEFRRQLDRYQTLLRVNTLLTDTCA